MKKTKLCRGCSVEKPIDDFPMKVRAKGTRQSRCRSCMSAANRTYRIQHYDAVVARVEERRRVLIERGELPTSKECRECGECKPLEDFNRQNNAPDGRQYTCRQCWQRIQKARRLANLEKVRAQERAANLKMLYGVSPEWEAGRLAAQGGVCAICGNLDPRGQRLHLDHCHETQRPRGLLCGPCNRGLGMFKDNPGLLRAAILYLEDSRKAG